MSEAELNELADRFSQAIEAGDLETVRSCYADRITIWHNFDQVVMSPSEHVNSLGTRFFPSFPDRTFHDVRRTIAGNKIIQQHVLRVVRPDGRSFDWPGCVIFEVEAGKIARLEEYVDMASFLQAMA